jgi:hypothetical protein
MGFPVKKRLEKACGEGKKEAVGNSGEEKEAAGTRGSQWKKRLWKILEQERLLELGVPLEKRGCGKLWGKRGCGNKWFPVKREAVGNSGEKEAAGTRDSQ